MIELFLLLLTVNSIKTANILIYIPAPCYSHHLTSQPIWRELSLRGHKVTVITPFPLKDKTLTNLTEIDVHDVTLAEYRKHNTTSTGLRDKVRMKNNIIAFAQSFAATSEAQLSHPRVKDLIINRSKYHFDLLITEFDLFIGFPFKDIYNCPLIGISSLPLLPIEHEFMGNPDHPIANPIITIPLNKNLNFFQRIESTLSWIVMRYILYMYEVDLQKVIYKHYGPKARTISEIGSETNLVFANVNPVLHPRRPNVPAIIEFWGIHIQPSKKLPQDLQAVLDNANNGVIYVNFGSTIETSLMPEEKIKIMIDTFAELPYTILWKFETNLLEKPKNVVIRKWFPQQDVLRHPNIKLFITQGGTQSLDEAIYFKIPVVVMPLIVDQVGNAKRIEEIDMGLSVDYFNLSKQLFKSIILRTLDERFKRKAEELSKVAQDQPMPALDTAVWWIEYVLRNRDTKFLRSASADLPWYLYYMLDVFAFTFATLFFVFYLIFEVLTKLYIFLINISVSKNKVD